MRIPGIPSETIPHDDPILTNAGSFTISDRTTHRNLWHPRFKHLNDELETFWGHAQEIAAIRFTYETDEPGSP